MTARKVLALLIALPMLASQLAASSGPPWGDTCDFELEFTFAHGLEAWISSGGSLAGSAHCISEEGSVIVDGPVSGSFSYATYCQTVLTTCFYLEGHITINGSGHPFALQTDIGGYSRTVSGTIDYGSIDRGDLFAALLGVADMPPPSPLGPSIDPVTIDVRLAGAPWCTPRTGVACSPL